MCPLPANPAGESLAALREMLVDAIPADPHLPSYPDVAAVVARLEELEHVREERAARRNRAHPVSAAEAYREVAAIASGEDEAARTNGEEETDSSFNSASHGDDEEEDDDDDEDEDVTGEGLTSSRTTRTGGGRSVEVDTESSASDDDLPSDLDLDAPIVVAGAAAGDTRRVGRARVAFVARSNAVPSKEPSAATAARSRPAAMPAASARRTRATSAVATRKAGAQSSARPATSLPQRKRLSTRRAKETGDVEVVEARDEESDSDCDDDEGEEVHVESDGVDGSSDGGGNEPAAIAHHTRARGGAKLCEMDENADNRDVDDISDGDTSSSASESSDDDGETQSSATTDASELRRISVSLDRPTSRSSLRSSAGGGASSARTLPKWGAERLRGGGRSSSTGSFGASTVSASAWSPDAAPQPPHNLRATRKRVRLSLDAPLRAPKAIAAARPQASRTTHDAQRSLRGSGAASAPVTRTNAQKRAAPSKSSAAHQSAPNLRELWRLLR